MERKENCPIFQVFDTLGKKWVLTILYLIKHGHHSFSDIAKTIPLLSGRVLSNRLTILQEKNLIIKKIESTTPIKSRYYLTELGNKISLQIEAI